MSEVKPAASQASLLAPRTFDSDAASLLGAQIAEISGNVPVLLDFGAVQVCHAFVFSLLLSKVAAMRRTAPVRLVHLNMQQRTLVAHLRLGSAIVADENALQPNNGG